MSKEINLDANKQNVTVDGFEGSMSEEDEYISLSDIVSPKPAVPDLSNELNEIPYDNEVVLGSSQNDELGQVNSHNENTLQLSNISESNAFDEYQPHTRTEGSQNGNTPKNLNTLNSDKKCHINKNHYERRESSSVSLVAEKPAMENAASVIQDSLLSTTESQSDVSMESQSKVSEVVSSPRRTKRGRVPNTLKYPITTDSVSNKNKPVKRRPGRPRKVPILQTSFEADSTNIDNINLATDNIPSSDGNGLDETIPIVKQRRRAQPKALLKEVPIVRQSKRSHKSIQDPLLPNLKDSLMETVEEVPLLVIEKNYVVENTKSDNVSCEMDLDTTLSDKNITSLTLNTTKQKKKKQKKGKKVNLAPDIQSPNLAPSCTSEDDADDVCLSKLKQKDITVDNITNDKLSTPFIGLESNEETKLIENEAEAELIDKVIGEEPGNITDVVQNNDLDEKIDNSTKRNSKMPVMSDFEYNVDKVVKEATADGKPLEAGDTECLLVEDVSKRRRTVKKSFVYDEGSDEDPFANIESSDDEPKRRKKGTKYYSDDEYIPGSKKRGGGKIRSSSSESENELNLSMLKKTKTRCSPSKKGRKSLTICTSPKSPDKTLANFITQKTEDDVEDLETTMIEIDDSLKVPAEAWTTSNEFENFIAKKTQGTSLKIKKVSSKEKTDAITPLEIPVLDQNQKTSDSSTQTKKASTSSISIQTSAPYDIPMKTNVHLTAAQSVKACEFLSSVVKTTVELGQLMSQKSNDFMNKKITTAQVTDTFKMDYCVRKSFLLFKLAKHNLIQMEEDLANQYEAFLKENNLSVCRETPKVITSKASADSDSDCEIVEVVGGGSQSSPATKQGNTKFNPKTVFLNKELSIKIAKKPSTPEKPVPGKKKLEIKGRHAVWINKNVILKKVTPTQSFLAQDSRNKKPPDTYVTEKMVSDFFKGYKLQKAHLICAPYLNKDWIGVQQQYECHYFISELDATNAPINSTCFNGSYFHFIESH